MSFPLHTIVGYHRELCDATILGQPVIGADLYSLGLGYNASVSTADHAFHHFARNHEEGRRFILSKLDGAVLELTELQQRAVDLVAKFGPFVVKKELDVIVPNTTVEYWHEDYKPRKLKTVVDAIEARSNALQIEGKAATGFDNAQMADDEVAAGLRHLTALDADRASNPNDVGWSKSVSPKAHWATAMLNTDRAAAIAIARKFIGGYTRQLRAGGIL